MLKKRESKEKDDEEAIAKLEQEVEMMEAEDEDTAAENLFGIYFLCSNKLLLPGSCVS